MRNFSFFRIILILSFFLFSSSIYADSGIFQTYVIIDSGSGNQFYAGGINADGAQVFNNSVLGTFDCESTLILNGGEVKTFKNNGSNVFGANIYYRIYSTSGSGGSFIQIPLSFNADLGNGDQKWQTSGHNVNMLSGLAAGTYNLEVYWDANTSDGTQFDSNNGTNFKATFTVEDNTPPPGQIQFAAPQLALDNVPEATQYNVVYELDIPTSSDWDVNSQIPYAVNNVSQLNGNPINRVAYLMQLDTKWVWVSYDAITQNYNEIGIPVDYQKQQVVSNMNVFASPNTGVTSGTNIQTGNIEFWSNCYAPTNYPNVPNAQGGNYDFGDSYLDPNTNQTYTPDCYGSFQIHNYANAQTIFGFNRWSSSIQNGPSDLGIGNNTNFQNGPHTDWTYTINAGIYNIKKLYILTLNNDNVASPLEDIIAQCEVSSLDAPTVMDNCAGEITGTTNTELPITTQGTTVVTWTFDDGSGNTSTQTQNVIIQDTEGPELTCNDVTVYLDNNGNATLGANSVTDFSGTQGQGNWSYGQYFAFQAGNFELMPDYNVVNVFPGPDDAWNNAGNAFATPFLYDAGGHPGQDLKWAVRRWTSNMDGDIYISGDFFDVNTPGGDGANIRILKNGNQVLEYLNIPSVSEPYAITLPVVQGDVIDFAIDPKFDYFFDTTHFTADIAVVSATDNCGLDSISLSTTSFNCNNIGSNNSISIIAQDVNGNSTNCTSNITVIDNEIPVINGTPGNITLSNIPGSCEAVATWASVTVSDNCTGATISSNYQSGDTFPLGTTTVTYTAEDAAGNEAASTSFTVTVNDTENPTITTCVDDLSLNTDAGICEGTLPDYTSQITYDDNCPFATGFVKVSAGEAHTLAIGPDGSLWAWGYNVYDALGAGPTNGVVTTPIRVGTDTDWVTIEAGRWSNLAIKSNGTLWAWGDNAYGQLGDGTLINKSTPTQIGTETNWESLATSYSGSSWNHSLGIRTDGTLWAWGWNAEGQLGIGNNTDVNVPTQVGTDTDWASIDIGERFSLALKTNGTLWSWGGNNNGQLGDGNQFVFKNVPEQVGTNTWRSVKAGRLHGVGIQSDGTLWTWGLNQHGQLGNSAGWGIGVTQNTPAQISAATDWASISAGWYNNLALKSNGELWVWGNNDHGQNGTLYATPINTLLQFGTATDWKTIETGAFHNTVFKNDGSLWAWGWNQGGQLGTGGAGGVGNSIPEIVQVPVFTPVVQDPAPGTLLALGDHTITYTVTDVSGNTTSCTQIITVKDNEVPTLSQNTALVDYVSNCDVAVPDVTSFASDNCSAIFIQSPDVGSLISGLNNGDTIVVTIFDEYNNGTPFTLTVADSTPPVLSSNSQVIDFVSNCQIEIPNVIQFANDNCPNGLSQNPAAGQLITISNGDNIDIVVTDSNGNEAIYQLTVNDITNPTITCPGDIIGIEATSAAGAEVTYTIPVGLDNCTATTVLTDGLASGSTFPIGTTTVTYTVTDASNNTASCSFDVEVVGVAPVIVCPANITVENDAGQCGAIVTFAATEIVGIPASTITYSHVSGSEFPVGTTTVTATATNVVGTSQCTFEITVNDTEDPIIACAADVTINNTPDECYGEVVLTPPTITDNCSDNALDFDGVNDFVSIPHNAGLTIGSNSLSVEFRFKAPNVDRVGIIVAKRQPVSPFNQLSIYTTDGTSFTNPQPGKKLTFALYASGSSYRIITTVNDIIDGGEHHFAAVSDSVSGVLKIYIDGVLQPVITYNVGAFPSIGNTMDYTIGSPNDNLWYYKGKFDELRIWNTARTQAEIQANMNTELNTTPGLVAAYHFNEGIANGNNSGVTTAADATGNANDGTLNNFALTGDTSNWVGQSTVEATWNGNPVTDNTQFDLGTNTVTWTVTDAAGNIATCAQTVTVIDNEVPTITCPSDITNVVATSASGAVVTYTAPTGMDNCTGATTTITTSPTAGLASGSTFPIGTTTVTYTVTDAANNKAECSFDVTVVGVTPDIVCPANITVENGAGQCGAIVTFAATETVGIPASTITYSQDPGTVFPVGTTTVTAIATNAVGTSECTFTVTVNDTQNPTIDCAADVEINNTPGECYGEVVLTPPTTTDNCIVTGNALNFDGVNDHIIVSNPNDFNLTATDDFTIQGLIKTTRDKATIFSKMTVGSPFGFQFWVWDGKLALEWGDGGISFIFSNTIVNDGQYHHVAAVVSRSSSNLKLYVDGVLEADVTNARYTSEINNSASVFIGQERSLNPNLRWQGDIDELAFFKSARTSSQILASTTSQLTGNEPNIVSYWKFNSGISGGNNAGITTAIDDNGNSHNGSLMNFALNGPSSNWVGGQTFGPTLTNDAPVTFAIGETTVTWTATDAAGNTATCAQTVTVIDNEVPTITCPSDITNVVATSASGAVVTYTAPVGTDNCTGATTTIVTSPTAGLASGSTFPIGTTTVTYTVTDAANNKAECSFDVTVVGVTPDIVCPANITVENDAGQCGAIVTFAATETVGIPASTITYSHASGSEFPVGTTTVTATATNAVGTDSCTFTITVSDTEDPVLVGVPGDVNSSCDAIPAAAVPTATDNCDNNVAITLNAVSTQDPNAANIGHYNYTITRTWTATDVAGNQDVQSQVITVSDTEDPVLVGVPGDVNSSCDAIPAAAVPTATDNCDNNVAIALNAVSTQDPNAANIGHYNYTITRTWTATDVAGNQDVQSQVITVSDTEDPVLVGVPGDVNASCDAIPAAAVPTATDNCDNNVVIALNVVSTQDPNAANIGHYNYTITRTWTATDVAGNQDVQSQVITVSDTEDPVLVGVPGDVNSSCDAIPAAAVPTATDNCDNNVAIALNAVSTQDPNAANIGHYNYTITRTWTATDVAGNQDVQSQVITVSDTEDPVLVGVPGDVNSSCDAIPAAALPTATDNCDNNVAIALNAVSTQDPNAANIGHYNYTITRTWTATDVAGNQDVQSQVITVSDTEDPVLVGVPGDVNSSCDAIPAAAVPTATDNCDNNVAIALNAVSTQDPNAANIGHYNYTITRTWTATDVAGNQDVQSQVITVSDTEDPVLVGVPGDVNASCDAIPAAAVPTATDNCDNNVVIALNVVSTQDPNAANIGHYNYTITRTWTATDVAGNQDVQSQVITVSDTEDPVLVGVPGDVNSSCDAIPAAAVPTATDNCDNNVAIALNAVSTQDPNAANIGHYNYTITRTWTATDVAGNQDVQSQVITVSDTEDPVLVGVPGDVNSSCDAIPAAALPTATDNCDNNVAIALNAVSTQDPNAANIGHYNYTITRTWTATDVAGNQDVQSQVITVSDTEDPVLVGVPGDVNSSCDAIPAAAVPTATDNCDNNVAIALNVVSTQDPNAANIGHYNYTITRTWTATDVAGNQDVQSQVITVSDTEAPDLGCLDIELLFENGASSGSITAADILAFATDNCDDDLEVHISQLDFDCGDIGGDLDDLIISEYVDGSFVDDGGLGYSKNCIEIYNGTGLPVNLSDYSLVIYADGSTTPTSIFPLGSTLANEDDDTGQTGVYTFCYTGFNEAPAQASALLDYDGNDAIALVKNGSQVDLIGIIGDNPGLNGWSNGTVSTGSKTLVRKKDALRGSTTNNTIDFLNQWTQYPEDDIVNLGSHEIEIEGFANNVIITVTDASGNSSTCLANVTVIELTPPTAIAQNVEVILDATGNGSTSPQLVDNGSSDNCGIGPLALDNETFTCADIATNPNMVTLTVTDVNGNSSTATAFVTVIDNLEPIVNTDDITIALGADGTYTLSQANIDALSKINAAQDPTSDNCGIASVTVSPNTFSCSDVGIEGVEVTVTVTDVNNNVNTATATVFVEDTVDPEAICADITVTLDSTGEVIVTGADVGFGSTDSCGIATYEIKRSADGDESFSDSITFYCEDEGANVVTIRVTDVNGNTDLCTANVTVDGDFPEVDITSSDLPEFCQGAVIVLTANSDLAVAYEWFFEGDAIATTESVEVDEDGEYTVIVTSATNCTAEADFIVSGFDKGSLLSAYTILATEEVFLIGSNTVQSGGVGAMLPGSGNVKLHQASTVVDFTQAATISLQQGSDAGDEILSAANPTLPDFMFNTVSNAGSPNAIVTGTQTLSGSVYNIVEVREGAEVTFSAPNVFINELKTWKDSAIEFEGCTNVLINERFQLAQNSTINLSSESKVTFYVNDDVSIEKGSYVRASIYAYNHNITAKGLNGNGKNIDPEPTFMTGLFIANRVQGNKNVVWNADDLCASCPVTYPNARTSDPKDVLLGEFDAKGWPSPSDTQFNIKVSTKNKADVVTIEVFDMGNKLVHSKQFNHDDTYRFGEKLEGGVYIVKISQGGSLKILRLIKN